MVEALPRAARPPDQSRVPSEMLDVTSTAVLAAILAPVQAFLLPYLRAQVIVAAKTSVRIDSLSCRVAFAAVRIAIDVGVGTRQLPWRQKLGAGWARDQHSSQCGRYHRAANDHHGIDGSPHSEKIQRYP
jgi:hypothetical protein